MCTYFGADAFSWKPFKQAKLLQPFFFFLNVSVINSVLCVGFIYFWLFCFCLSAVSLSIAQSEFGMHLLESPPLIRFATVLIVSHLCIIILTVQLWIL